MPRLGNLDKGTRHFGERDVMPHDSRLYQWRQKQIIDPEIPWGSTFDRLFADEIDELNTVLDERDYGKDAE